MSDTVHPVLLPLEALAELFERFPEVRSLMDQMTLTLSVSVMPIVLTIS